MRILLLRRPHEGAPETFDAGRLPRHADPHRLRSERAIHVRQRVPAGRGSWYYNYDVESELVLDRLRLLDDQKKMEVEWFDDKLSPVHENLAARPRSPKFG